MAQYDHWMPLNVGDYLADTMHLTTLQHGIYVRLIMHYWKRRGLPWELRQLAQISGVSVDKLRRFGGPVLALFTAPNGKPATLQGARFDSLHPPLQGASFRTLQHRRLDAELIRAQEVSGIKKNAGAQGAEARWGKRKNGHNGGVNSATTDSICHPFANSSRARATPTPTTTKEDSPQTPRKRGANGGAVVSSRRGGPHFRNGFATLIAEDLQERIDHAEADDARRGATVVQIPRSAHRH
jgi:uncharacterized protein YdaU (DUF1376 family)